MGRRRRTGATGRGKHNKQVYKKIAKEMREQGSYKTGVQCRAKMKKLRLDHKIKDDHKNTGREQRSMKRKISKSNDLEIFHFIEHYVGTQTTSNTSSGSCDGAEVQDDDLSPVNDSFSLSTTITTCMDPVWTI